MKKNIINFKNLATLPTIQEENDVKVWLKEKQKFDEIESQLISIIIPVCNDSKNIKNTILKVLKNASNIEIIVVDSNSTDTSTIIDSILLEHKNCKLVSGSNCKSVQMNIGSKVSKGDILLFIEAVLLTNLM
jgi:glycosyltransferase involved in cell wall biosynthesis